MSPIYIQGVEQGVGGGGGDAYLTVAAADTPATLKGRADYVCDGTNLTGGDQVEINNALGAAGVVILCPGTYWIDSSISMASGKSLIGGGDGCILKLKNAINADIHMIVNSDIAVGNERILVKDLTLDGNSGNNAAGNQIGINFTKVKYSKVRNNWIKNFRGSGISIVATTSTEDEIIANIVMECCVGGGDAGIILDEPQRCIIAENICYYNKCYGIYLLTAKYNAVIGNACYRNTNIGILLGSGADGNIVSGNACYDNGICGISISLGYNNSITGNTISKNPAGITLSYSNGNTISDNTCCEQDGGSGISLAISSNNVIKGNVCRKNRDHGIQIGTSHHNLISGNYCYENQQKGYGTADNIYLSASDYNHILGNTCRKGALATFPAYGINISNNTCDKNMVKDNDLYDAGATANLNDAGTETVVRSNRGYLTENSGAATITYLAAPAAATAAEGAAGNVDIGAHSWKVTLVNDEAEETDLGTKSNVVTIADSTKKVNLTDVPTGAAGTASRKIYRTVAGDAGDYKLVGTINDNATTIFEDNVADVSLGAVAPAANGTGLARTVTHGLASTPTRAYAIPTSDPGAANAIWISNKGATTFKINVKVAVSASTTLDWRAKVGEG